MKLRTIFFAVGVLLSTIAFAQEKKQYLDPQLNVTLNESAAKFIRTIIHVNDTVYNVNIHFKTGEIMMTGAYRDAELNIENGDFTYYYANGIVESQGKYRGGNKVGIWKRWNYDGQQKPDRIYQDEDFEYNNRASTPARFPGGMTELKKLIRDNVTYPAEAKEKHISGTVYVNFVVDKKGAVTQAVVANSVYYQLDEEALRFVSNLPDWEPAKRDGKPVASNFILPIRFGEAN
jgi:TonB family protein